MYNKQRGNMSLEKMLKRNIRIKELTDKYIQLKQKQFMAKQTKIVENVLGTEPTNTEGLTTENIQEIEKQRKDSFPYAVKQLKEYIEKVERNKWLEGEDLEQLKGVHRKLIEKYIGLSMF